MMKRSFLAGPALLPVLLLALSCGKESAPLPEAQRPEGVPIHFESVLTKAGDVLRTGDSIRVWAEDESGNSVMNGQLVTLTENGWEYAPVKYWPQAGNLTFYAVSPGNPDIIRPEDDGDPYCFDVFCPEDASTDILCANMSSFPNGQSVCLNFEHIMARISIQARLARFPVDPNAGVRITAISIGTHPSQGSWRVDDGGWPGYWSRTTFRQELSCTVTRAVAMPVTDFYLTPIPIWNQGRLTVEWETYNKKTGETIRARTGTEDISGTMLDEGEVSSIILSLSPYD